jgi:hypothetical protein
VSPSSPIVLASSALNRSGDTLIIELVQPDAMPAMVRIVWPAKPTITAPHPERWPPLRLRWCAVWRRRRRNSPRRSGTAADRCRRAARCMKRGISG